MMADREDGFPASDRVGTDDRVDCGQVRASVVRGATLSRVHFEAAGCSSLGESGLSVSSRKGFEEFLVGD